MDDGFFARPLTGSDLTATPGPRLVDVLDRLLARGVVARGEIWLSVADVDLLFIGADLVLASPDAIAPPHDKDRRA